MTSADPSPAPSANRLLAAVITGIFALLAGDFAVSAHDAAQTPAAVFDEFGYAGSDPTDASARPATNQYRNPILSGFYPDPSITRVGDDYYLVASTFSWFPGIPVFHSRDLVSWSQIGNAIDRPGQLDFGRLGLSRGVFAPSIEHHRGVFYIFNTCVDCGGNFVVTATDPAGPWSDPIWLPDLEGGIDPSLFVDADGSAWTLNNGPPASRPRYDGHRAIWIQRFDLKTLRSFGPRKVLIDGGVDPAAKPIWIEGPHIFRRHGYYYLIAAEGGTAEGHSQVALRSRAPDGPYEVNPSNPILTQRDLPRDRPHPITSAGHADFVETAKGEWWASFLAVRPYTGDLYNTGRETFLLPVQWENGWPRITAPGETIARVHVRPDLPRQPAPAAPTSGPFSVTETFDGPLGPQWMMMRNPRARWHRIVDGKLMLEARAERLGDHANPSLLARRQQHRDAEATTMVRFDPVREGDRAGLVALQSDDHWYLIGVGVEEGQRSVIVERRAGPNDPAGGRVLARAPLAGTAANPIRLRIVARGASYRFDYAMGGGAWRTLLADADGRILSTKVAGGFVGAVFGLYAHAERPVGQ